MYERKGILVDDDNQWSFGIQVRICDNTVVGACAVVTKKYKEGNCILAGNPARVVREDVSWERSYPVKYE